MVWTPDMHLLDYVRAVEAHLGMKKPESKSSEEVT
jgi:hypothetical protein